MIQNSGDTTLTVSSVAYPEGFTGDWNSGSIAVGASQTVNVTFAPTAGVQYGDTLTVSSDKTDGTDTLGISGIGNGAGVVKSLSFDPFTINLVGLNFGMVSVKTPKQMSFTILNTGNSRVTVSSITYPAGYTGDWNSGTIAALGSQTVNVTFAPTQNTNYVGTVTVNSDADIATFKITGGGSTDSAAISLSGSLDFGNVPVNTTKRLSFKIVNQSFATPTVSSITYPAGFTGDWDSGTIGIDRSQTVNVTFAPTREADYSGTATVNSDADLATTFQLGGAGTNSIAAISLSGSLDFGNIPVNTTKRLSFMIKNTSLATMTVSSITYPDGFTGDWNSGTIAAGASKTVNVTFAPTQSQSYSGTVTVNSDAAGTNTVAISGSGVIIPTPVSVDGSLDFGRVFVGMNQKRTFTIRNTGNDRMFVSSITYPVGFIGDWSGGIAAGASQTVSVFFAPTQSQSYSGTVTVNSDKTGGVNTITASGKGLGITLKKDGSGNGELKSSVNSMNMVELSATAYSGSSFNGWSPPWCEYVVSFTMLESSLTCTGTFMSYTSFDSTPFKQNMSDAAYVAKVFNNFPNLQIKPRRENIETGFVSVRYGSGTATITFAKPVSSVSATVADYSGNTVFTAYNAAGAVLKSIPITNPAAQIYTIDNVGDIASAVISSPDADFVELGYTTNVVRGDINFDGDGDLKDTILMLQVLADVDAPATLYPVFSLSGKQITLEDAVFTLQKVAGLR